MKKTFLFLFALSFFAQAEPPMPLPKRSNQRVAISRNQRSVGTTSRSWMLGAVLGGDGIMASAVNTQVAPTGFGYSVGLLGRWDFLPRFKAILTSSYQYLRLGGEAKSTSTQIVDPNPAMLRQSARYLGVAGLIGYNLNPRDLRENRTEIEWWLEAGTQVLFPLSAVQSVADSERTFTAGKSVLSLLGVTADIFWDPRYVLSCSLQAYASLSGDTATRLYGIRLMAGFNWRI